MRLWWLITVAIVLTVPHVYSLPCTDGLCCEDGNILPNGTVCRQALDDCDVTEYCTGLTSDCPPDEFHGFETFCKSGSEMGLCENGTCRTIEIIENYEMCLDQCSAERGKCTLKGVCVCDKGWQSPPICDKKTGEENEETEMPEEQVLNRHRRRVETNVLGSTQTTDNKKQFSIQDPPQNNNTKLKEHPLFIPVVIMLTGFIILVVFTISAKMIYDSEMKAKWIRRRMKVEKTSSELPKTVSKIDDPTVNIDVQH